MITVWCKDFFTSFFSYEMIGHYMVFPHRRKGGPGGGGGVGETDITRNAFWSSKANDLCLYVCEGEEIHPYIYLPSEKGANVNQRTGM